MTEIKTVWFDREKARNVLAMMKRGESVRVNGTLVKFTKDGFFQTNTYETASLKSLLSYLLGEHELPKTIEQSLKEVS